MMQFIWSQEFLEVESYIYEKENEIGLWTILSARPNLNFVI